MITLDLSNYCDILIIVLVCTTSIGVVSQILKKEFQNKMERLADQVVNDLLNPKIKKMTYTVDGNSFVIITKKDTPYREEVAAGEYVLSVSISNNIEKDVTSIEVVLWKKMAIIYSRKVDVIA